MKRCLAVLVILTAAILLYLPGPILAGPTQGRSDPLKVEIVSLREGERIRGGVSIEARVNRPDEVSYVEFYFQEPGAEDRYSWMSFTPPYVWGGQGQTLDTTLFDDGPASAVAFCFPKAKGAPMVQHRVHVIIDNGKPKVKIISPKDRAVINGDVIVEIDASDRKGTRKYAGINAVFLYLDGELFRTLTRAPFRSELSTCLLTQGLHSIRAVAEDSKGLTGADTIIIEVHGGARAPQNKDK